MGPCWMKPSESETPSSSATGSRNIRAQLSELIDNLKRDVERIVEPRFEALVETSAEVLKGVRTAFERYDEHRERAEQAMTGRPKSNEARNAPAGESPPVNAAATPPGGSKGKTSPAARPANKPNVSEPVTPKLNANPPDPDEVAAKNSILKKAARTPQRSKSQGVPQVPVQSGKPIWDKPHSS
ncbi:MAG: hypothetical protein JWM32_1654 [Verrucomicrobia bacterium]|nr:hypothetical protein [Verrucomicrobiota bacterium]